MTDYRETRERIAEVDAEIQKAKQNLRRLEEIKRSLVWHHYYGSINAILLRKRLKARKAYLGAPS